MSMTFTWVLSTPQVYSHHPHHHCHCRHHIIVLLSGKVMFGSMRQVNGINVEACTHDEVVTLLKQAEGPIITLAVRHFRPASHFLNKSKSMWTNHVSAWVSSGKQQISFTEGYLCQQTMCGHGYFQLISKIISSTKVSLSHQPCEWQWMYGLTSRTVDVHSLTFRMVHVQLDFQCSWYTVWQGDWQFVLATTCMAKNCQNGAMQANMSAMPILICHWTLLFIDKVEIKATAILFHSYCVNMHFVL